MRERLGAEPGQSRVGSCDAAERVLAPAQGPSAIIRIEINREKRQQIPDLDFFHRFVRSLFFHRRKLCSASMISASSGSCRRPTSTRCLDERN